MNRNKIKTNSGSQYITVPVLVKGRFGQNLNEVEINNQYDWRRNILGAIKQNYCKTPFFNQLYNKIETIINNNYTKLLELNIALLNFTFEYLEINKMDIKILYSSKIQVSGKGTERLINFCKKFRANKYISGIHGKDYLEISAFKKEGIEIIWHEFKPQEYKQQFSGFIPHLSILDAFFNIGKDTIKLLKSASL